MAAPTFVKQTVGNAAAANNATATVTSTTGNLLVALVARSGGTATGALTGVVDSATNTWLAAAVTRGAVSGVQHTRIECWACPNANAVTSVTFQSSTSQYYAWNIIEFADAALSAPTDVASPDYSGVASSTTIDTPSIDTTNANDIVIAAIHYAVATGSLTGGNITNALTDFNDAGNTGSGRAAYEIVSATGSYSATWTLGTARATGVLTVAFKGSAETAIGIDDGGTGADSITVDTGVTQKTPTDAAVGADSSTVTVTAALADSGLAVTALAPAAVVAVSDAGTASTALAVTVGPQLADSATGTDGLAVSAAVGLSASGAAITTVGVAAATIVADAAAGSDSLARTADSPALEVSGFGTFPEIHSFDDVTGVLVAINQYASDLTMDAPTFQLWDGTAAQVGTTQTGTVTTSPGHVDTAMFTGVSYSQLATLRVRIYAHGPAGTIHSVNYVALVVDYTPGVAPPAVPYMPHGVGVAAVIQSGLTAAIPVYVGGSTAAALDDTGRTVVAVLDSGRGTVATILNGGSTVTRQGDSGLSTAHFAHNGTSTVVVRPNGSGRSAVVIVRDGAGTTSAWNAAGQTAALPQSQSGQTVGVAVSNGRATASAEGSTGETTAPAQQNTGQSQAVAR